MAFAGLEVLFLNIQAMHKFAFAMTTGWNWLLMLGAYFIVAVGADRLARSNAGIGVQLAGLGLFIVIMALIGLPLILPAATSSDPGVIQTAGLITLAMVCGLSTFTLMSGTNFSWLGGIVYVGCFVALGLIVASVLFGFSLSVIFAGAVVLLMASALLYQTSALMYEWNTNQHIAAALGLFASVITMFLNVLWILGNRD